METNVYVDVLLVVNYVVNAVLLTGTARLLGAKIPRRKLVGAALLGALGSLAIFLPFMGFFPMLVYRVLLSAAIVLIALPREGWAQFVKGWATFFAVNFFFAGVMLGIWLLFAPGGMIYSGGIVYFNINPLTLLVSTAAAYGLLGLIQRFSRAGRLVGTKCRVTVKLGGKSCSLGALIDTGNSLYEPFSGIPVIVCSLQAVRAVLPPELADAIQTGDWEKAALQEGVRIRLIPFSAMGGRGTLPGLRVDELIVRQNGGLFKAELCYMAVSAQSIGADGSQALLNPDLIGKKLKMKCGVNG